MGIEDRIRQEADALGQEMASALAAKLKTVADQLAAAAAEDRSGAEALAMARFADDLANAREEAERAQQAAVSQARSETEQRLGSELDRARAEAEAIKLQSGRLVEESDRLKGEATHLKDELARLREVANREREEANRVKEASSREIETANREKEAATRQIETANREKEAATREIEAANREKEAATREKETANREKEAATREIDTANREKEAATREKETANREKEALAREKENANREKEAATREKENANREKEAATREKEAANREREAANRQAAAEVQRRAAEREAMLAGLDRLAAAVRRIDASSALTDVLGVLADAAAAETARVALFVAAPATPGAPPRFKPWRLHGFPSPPNGFDLGLTSAKELARTGLPFAPLGPSRAGVAIPIDVGGQTVAMVYADDGEAEHASPASWPEAIELVARHAASRIETVTAVRTAQVLGARTTGAAPDEQSARRYAKLLVSEIKMYNEASVKLGRTQRDLYERLRPEIERARHLFEERVPALGARQAFDDELVQTLADGDSALLGAPQARKHA